MKQIKALYGVVVFWSFAALHAGCGGTIENTPEPSTPKKNSTQPIETAAPAKEVVEKAFIWKATSSAMPDKTLYLLGSVHAANANFYPLDPIIEEAYQVSDVLVVELNLTSIPKEKMLQVVLSRAVLPPDQNLENSLSKETWSKLTKTLKKHNVPAASFMRFKPWFAALTVVTLRIVESGYSPTYGIDQHFTKKGDKEIVELESVDSQLALFDDLPKEIEEVLVLDAIEGSLQSGGNLEQIMIAWQAGDAEALHKIMFSSVKQQPELEPLFKRMFTDRNHTMAKRIEELLKKHNSLFVVIGAGHLVGDQGVVDIFLNKGYSVVQLEKKE